MQRCFFLHTCFHFNTLSKESSKIGSYIAIQLYYKDPRCKGHFQLSLIMYLYFTTHILISASVKLCIMS